MEVFGIIGFVFGLSALAKIIMKTLIIVLFMWIYNKIKNK